MKIRAAVLKEIGLPYPFAESKPMEVMEVDLAEPGDDEVLVRIEAASLCHSDLSVVNGSRSRPVPMVLGHEASGTVVSVGDAVTKVKVGDHVCMTFQPHCGECDLCEASDGQRCSTALEANLNGTLLFGRNYLSANETPIHHHTGVSAFAEAAVVHESTVIPVAKDVPFEIAAVIACAVTTGGGAVKNAGKVKAGEKVAVVGGGGVGIAALMVAKALGAASVDVIDPSEGKHDLLKSLGADAVYKPEDAPLEKYDLVVEAAGVGPAMESTLKLLVPGGRAVCVGLPAPEVEIKVNALDLVNKNKTLIGSYHGSGEAEKDIAEYVELWREGRLPLENLFSGSVPIEDINQALDNMTEAQGLRQLIKIHNGE
ncbi:alcohol dehydrogenase catalytic domain-containing protein [Corynebacterium riegelii]|uniref:alcohol dehydrogenase catalytic domain-containing protein n=1 Tax=Corynebacterium riegelii TaxID=156976 RepID=UPI00288A13C0|nr:alcohol dehydrogenase catalytic domain-containing protein [Corynebacterium riegelii]